MAPVHTARGESESKHLRPTPAGHAEGCPVIALCRPGSPWQAGRGPVGCESGPGGHSPRSTGQGPPGHRVAPSPALAALLSSAGLKSLALSGGSLARNLGRPSPWPPALQLVGGVGGGSGGSLGPPGPGQEVKSGRVRRHLQKVPAGRGGSSRGPGRVDGAPLKTQPAPRQTAKGPAHPAPR